MTETADRITIESHLDERSERRLADDVLDGLTRPFKEIPPKHFYDARGSALFERICALPEYYPSRTELAILRAHAGEIAATARPGELVELGSGAATKARLLLGAMDGAASRYVPFDVSETAIRDAAAQLVAEMPDLNVHGVVGDFERHLDRIPEPLDGDRRLVALLGGTVGNFRPAARRRLLREVARLMGRHDRFLLGTDLVKDPAVIEAAYDDRAGVTAEFNRNLLHVINRELGADFEPGDFQHVAFYDPRHEWVEMRLRARRACRVHVPALGLDVAFAAGEELRTEISAKFTPERIDADLASAGLEAERTWTDPHRLFAVTLARHAR